MPRSSASWRRVEELHRKAEIGKAHRDAAAHRAGADHRRGLDLGAAACRAGCRQLRDLALGEERIAQRARLVGVFQLVEQLALAPDALVERHACRPPRPRRCSHRAPSGCGRAARSILRIASNMPGSALRLGELVVAVADARQRPLVGDPAGKGDRRLAQIVALRHQLVDDAEPVRLLGRARGGRRRSSPAPPSARSAAAAAACRRRPAGCRSAPRAARPWRSAPRCGSGRRARSPARRRAHSRGSPRRPASGCASSTS